MADQEYGGTAILSNGEPIIFWIIYDSMTAAQKLVYDSFMGLNTSSGYNFTILNTPYTIDSGICSTHMVCTDNVIELDYQAMSDEDKAIVDAFEGLLVEYIHGPDEV